MVKYSRFTHTYDLGDAVALYHSLRMKPVYLKKDTYESLQTWLASSSCYQISNAPDNIINEVTELARWKILTQEENEDDKVFNFVKSHIPTSATSICYFILSEQCNLACKYCFLGNNDKSKRSNFCEENMSIETADKAIEFFVRQMKESNMDPEESEPAIIFYGGEPLVNFPVLEYVASKINSLRETEKYLKKVELSMVSNGLLLTEDRINRLTELGVSIAISIDGATEEANSMRVDVAGNPVYHKILDSIKLCQKLNANISLSITLSEDTIKNTQNVLDLIDKYNIKSLGFNIMMSSDTFVLPQKYNEEAAQFIIDEFIELRKRGVYEDRMMRKLKAFSKAKIYFSDCGATAGGQIVISPNGQVGICHGCLHNKEYFVSNINDDKFIAVNDPTFKEWSSLTPLNNEECYSCEALGICGGGCPINAMYLKEGNTIHSLDERFCVHSKKTLEFFIKDLYEVINNKNR